MRDLELLAETRLYRTVLFQNKPISQEVFYAPGFEANLALARNAYAQQDTELTCLYLDRAVDQTGRITNTGQVWTRVEQIRLAVNDTLCKDKPVQDHVLLLEHLIAAIARSRK